MRPWRAAVLVAVAAAPVALADLTGAGTVGADPLMTESRPLVVSYAAATGEEEWRYEPTQSGVARVLAADDRHVFVEVTKCLSYDRDYRRGDRELRVLDAKTGRVRWTRADTSAQEYGAGAGTTVVDADALSVSSGTLPIVAVADARDIRGLDPRTGRTRWTAPASGSVPVLVADGDVVLADRAAPRPGTTEVPVRALDRRTGTTRWATTVPGTWLTSVAAHGGSLFLFQQAGTGGQVTVLDRTTGDTTSSFPVELAGVNPLDFVVGADVVATSGYSGGSTATTSGYDAASGGLSWTRIDSALRAGSTTTPQVLFGVSTPAGSASVYVPPWAGPPPTTWAVDARTGTTLWSVVRRDLALGVADDTVISVAGIEYEGSWSVVDHLAGLDPATGAQRWEVRPGDPSVPDYERRFPDTWTVSVTVGTRSAYVYGGCAATSHN